MPQVIAPFNIMAKPVCGTCNLDCHYCYYSYKGRELYPHEQRFLMTPAVLEAYTHQYMEAMPTRVEFGWQGGEPLLAGKEFFRQAVEFQKANLRPGQTISNAIQTNGTLLDDQWCEFLAEYKFLVGISLDGPPQWHDAFRTTHDGGASFHKAWAGLELLRKHKVEFNVLVTLNRVNAPHAADIYRYFVNRGVQYLQFIPILERNADGSPADYSCTPAQFGRFCLDVLQQWASRDVGKVSERLIDTVLHTMLFGTPSTCCQAPRCGNAHVLEFNGDLYACDHFVYRQWKIGNIMDRPLAELVTDAKLDEFNQMKLQLPRACEGCEFLKFCNGGCPKHHVPIGTDPSRVNYFCEGYKMFFSQALGVLAKMAPYIRQGRVPPPEACGQGAIAAAPQSPHFEAGPGAQGPKRPYSPPGRNNPCPCGSGRKYKACCGR
jgi:uncharacterized protein